MDGRHTGMRQKSAIHFSGVLRLERSERLKEVII